METVFSPSMTWAAIPLAPKRPALAVLETGLMVKETIISMEEADSDTSSTVDLNDLEDAVKV